MAMTVAPDGRSFMYEFLIFLYMDTGASDLVLFASAMSDCQDAIKKIGTRAWSNMGGEIQVDRVQLKDAYLGITSWSAQDVFILPDGGNPPAGLRGLLGIVSLKARRVGFDPDQRIIAWDRENGPAQIAKAARYPIVLHREKD